jgi:hypothetical protein
VLIATATVGTTLAPWGLSFIQSYAVVDMKLTVADLRYERIDVVTGAVLTGVIGFFVVVACAATLHVQGITIDDAADAAGALTAGRQPRRQFVRRRTHWRGAARRGEPAVVDGVLGLRVQGVRGGAR